jgi:signal transduction histidine kinase
MLGHELRNPLAPILTALQLMRLRNESGAVRERTIIERQVNHMVSLVDDLLDVSRIRVESPTETRTD